MQENAERRHSSQGTMIVEDTPPPATRGRRGGGGGSASPTTTEDRSSASWNYTPVSSPLSKYASPPENQQRVVPFRSPRLTYNSSSSTLSLESDIELMKEKFGKLLLGEDMSGAGKGVCSAVALSNAITNLAASVFGEQKRLEPMSRELKARWRKEIDWLLSVTDYIVVMCPAQLLYKDGTCTEVMHTQQREDLDRNIPSMRRMDSELIDFLDTLKGQTEFYYVSKDDGDEKEKNMTDGRWWIPTPKVPPGGLSDTFRSNLELSKKNILQKHKCLLELNAYVLETMKIPQSYTDSLPKNGRASLGDTIYKGIADDHFEPGNILENMDLTSEHKILDLKNKIEASIVIWKKKKDAKEKSSSWSSGVTGSVTGSGVSPENRAKRADEILKLIKLMFPGIPQSSLDISKIQYNRDVGLAIMESYSRVLEGFAYTIMSRIEDVLHADSIAKNGGKKKSPTPPFAHKFITIKQDEEDKKEEEEDEEDEDEEDDDEDEKEETEKRHSAASPGSMTLLDYIGWSVGEGDTDQKQETIENLMKDCDLKKPADISIHKKTSYIAKLELGGCRSPTARH